MSTTIKSVRDYAHSHPISVAAGLIIALPGSFFYITGKSICSIGVCNDATSTQKILNGVTNGMTIYDPIDQSFRLPVSKSSDKPAPTHVIRIFHGSRRNATVILTSLGNQLGVDVKKLIDFIDHRWTPYFPLSRMVSVATTTALPGAFTVLTRKYPHSWAARHQTKIANVLHVLTLVTVANQTLSVQDILVAALVVVSFEALQRLSCESETPAVIESLMSQTNKINTGLLTPNSRRPGYLTRKHSSSNPELTSSPGGNKDVEIDRLRKQFAELRTTEKAMEIDLKRTKTDLFNARTTLTETFSEFSSMRSELKTMKQTLGRDHQAVIYRKDIELFALRKANEQKEKCIKDREVSLKCSSKSSTSVGIRIKLADNANKAKLQDIQKQHKAILQLKDSELRNLEDRVTFLERQAKSSVENDGKIDSATDTDAQAALQIKFLRVKGRSSMEIDERTLEEKDQVISRLKTELADAASASGRLQNAQIELRRAWDETSNLQRLFNDERRQHTKTQERLREATMNKEEEVKENAQNFPGRLPTIDEQERHELEAMFNTAQQDNSRLYGEVDALEKRVREANARVFVSEQAAESLREQLRLEKAINDDMETARPSVVHRVHFQRMEGQLKEGREELQAKIDEITHLKKTIADKDAKFEELSKAQEISMSAHIKLQEENARLIQSVKELESTKDQLMLDHERLARQRTRNRTTSGPGDASARSSATLVTEPTNTVNTFTPIPSEEELLLPPRPVSVVPDQPSSIQGTPERFVRREISNREPSDREPSNHESANREPLNRGSSNHAPSNRAPSNRAPSHRDPSHRRSSTRLNMISNDVPPTELRHKRPKSLTLKGLMRKIVGKDNNEAEKSEKEDRKTVESARPRTAMLPKDKTNVSRPKTATPLEEGAKGTTNAEERPRTAAMPSAKLAKRPDHKRYYSESRPKTPAPEGVDGRTADEDQRPKSRGWAAS